VLDDIYILEGIEMMHRRMIPGKDQLGMIFANAKNNVQHCAQKQRWYQDLMGGHLEPILFCEIFQCRQKIKVF